MPETLLLSPATPYVIAAAVLLAGLFLLRRGRRAGRLVGRMAFYGIGGLAALGGAALLVGAVSMTLAAKRIEAARPAAGKLVTVGDASLFILCEGPRTADTIVWLSGGYSAGGFLGPLHDAVKAGRRSCLVDRPGTGWAGPASFPRTLDHVLREVVEGVTEAGETGPLILAGHSMGGLYAANIADAYPGRTRALILLDPTPPTWFIEQQSLFGCGPSAPGGLPFWASMFGLGLVKSLNPMNADDPGNPKAAFGARWPLLVDQESRPMSLAAARSALFEACRNGIGLVRTPGSLGDLPVLMMVQTQTDAELLQQLPPDLSPREQANWKRIRAQWPKDYVGFTSRGELVRAPEGAGHQFPITRKAETLAAIDAFLARLDSPAAQPGIR